MRYGVYVPNFGPYGDARVLADLAYEAEEAGWDGFFLWDQVSKTTLAPTFDPMVDLWIALAAIALRTRTIRLGPLVTPLPRRRPWMVARETVSLDHLSAGRLIFGVGSGGGYFDFEALGEASMPKRWRHCWTRASRGSLGFGAASHTSTKGLLIISRKHNSCRARFSLRAFPSGWRVCGPRKRLCAAQLAGTVLSPSGAIYPSLRCSLRSRCMKSSVLSHLYLDTRLRSRCTFGYHWRHGRSLRSRGRCRVPAGGSYMVGGKDPYLNSGEVGPIGPLKRCVRGFGKGHPR